MAYKKDLATGLIGRAIDTKATSLVLLWSFNAKGSFLPNTNTSYAAEYPRK